ncbi:ABC transporter permease [Robiginitalea sp.]|jgi:putative ABC transport system permease protein|uniref:ABC transporter permease n=1 Tax=Robiginitalea sp. TaxID=1902411 RepID=UPI003C77BB5B
MKDVLFLAWNYLKYHWAKTLFLLMAISLVIFIPLALDRLAEQGSEKLLRRAVSTPLLLGARGSATELCLSSLYFKSPKLEGIPFNKMKDLEAQELAQTIPLQLEYRVRDQPIVGTTSAYFSFRGLDFAEGRSMALLGECVLGSKAAEKLNVKVGGSVISSPAGAFDLAGSFPLKMTVVGVLQPSQSPDDEAVFTDVKTTWVISGKAHGHQDVDENTADSLLLSRSKEAAIASPAVLSYMEITPDNIGSFHFHGNPLDYLINAVIAVPKDKKSELMLRGRYEQGASDVQLVLPEEVIEELVDTVISVRDLLLLAALSIGMATLLVTTLVFLLSIQLRKREIATMKSIGAAPGVIRGVLLSEILMVIGFSLLLAGVYILLLQRLGIPLLEKYI